ncbi:hypothetical protein X801_05339, partial [Opisthorchis viverrini]
MGAVTNFGAPFYDSTEDLMSTALRNLSTAQVPRFFFPYHRFSPPNYLVRAVELTQVDPNAVFVNNEVKLSNLQIFGFDFDHTLATYTKSLDEFIFNEARDWMVKQLKYPDDLMNFTYSPDFAIRGLHYDVKKGYLMKVDAYHHIQLDTVYRGFTPVSCEETLEVYNGSHLPSDILKQNTLTSSALAMRSSSK